MRHVLPVNVAKSIFGMKFLPSVGIKGKWWQNTAGQELRFRPLCTSRMFLEAFRSLLQNVALWFR